MECEKECKDCGKSFKFSGSVLSLNKRKFCDDCRIAHKTRSPSVPFDEVIVDRPVEPELPPLIKVEDKDTPPEIKKPIGKRQCIGCGSMIYIFSNRGKRKQYCKSCKTIRARASNLRYLEKYVENQYVSK